LEKNKRTMNNFRLFRNEADAPIGIDAGQRPKTAVVEKRGRPAVTETPRDDE
jgi:hypothetical protein